MSIFTTYIEGGGGGSFIIFFFGAQKIFYEIPPKSCLFDPFISYIEYSLIYIYKHMGQGDIY